MQRLRSFVTAAVLAVTSSLVAADLDGFWRGTLERLARDPMEAKVEPLKDPLPYKTFLVTLRGLDGVHFRARLALPIQGEAPAKPWPVIVTAPGYGSAQQGVMLGECQRGYAILQVFPRSQGESAELWKIDGPDKLTWRLDQPEGAYYQGAYADMVRAVDFAVSRPEIDRERVALVGTSQGGGIVLAAAALDPRVKVVVAHVPFLCDFRLAARTPGSLVNRLLAQAKRNDDAALQTLDYFDPLQLAPRLRLPVLVSAGGKDVTCPEHTIRSVFERIPSTRKTLKFYPDLPHTTCLDFYNFTWTWLDEHFRSRIP